MYTHTYTCTYIYIYIYRERERVVLFYDLVAVSAGQLTQPTPTIWPISMLGTTTEPQQAN